ncbi:adenosylcobinamide-phosphate synthase CbiB [Variovorax sp. PAMC 28711]|uniref:adenosylcobinamide-phosphate synthase CbiB n=1 Tax=Variovorax sp. PAMC 28711 TaxID=1795631 RepID=UPI00078ECBB4|nr:adenosylcobinamide-phosphate synthase CbiB [Variovorax sp. PAMC 28711]AMM26876.1 cobalamin biosynthesis protein CobD [Variovorax sp. PAMC 28711]
MSMAGAFVPVLALWLALAVDWRLGEPPARWHPVVWMGHYLGWIGRRIAPLAAAGSLQQLKPFVAGALAWCAGAAMVLIAALAVGALVRWLPWWAGGVLLGVALKPLLAWRMLRDEVLAVEAALGVSLDAGSAQLARLVSRDVSDLTAAAVRESAIESLAENLNDSVVAPVFWFVLLGLPGAAVYRFANTADAMWGYRGERGGRDWSWAGKFAARADDVLSWVPARITALLLGVAARHWPSGLWREAARTPSPNSGWPMAAMALLLGVRLGKPGVYVLNAAGRTPEAAELHRAARWGAVSVVWMATAASVTLWAAARA